jgi:hypothetical protein
LKGKSNVKKIWYAIVETMEVPDNATDKEIDDLVIAKATENGTIDKMKDCMWSFKDDLFDFI